MKRGIALLVILLGAARPAPAAPEAKVVPDDFRRDIVRLMEITGASQMGLRIGSVIAQQMYATLRHYHPDLPEAAAEVMDEVAFDLFQAESASLTPRVIPLYAEHFTHDEVRELIAFYETAVGRKLIHEMPLVMEGAVQETRVWSRSVHPKLEPLLLQRFKQAGWVPVDAEGLFPPPRQRPSPPAAAPGSRP